MAKEQNEEKPEDKARQRHLSSRHWESAVDKQIREAMERGEFDNLQGIGKPLNLEPDQEVPEDMALAFKILKNAGFAPEWIESDQELRKRREKLFEPFRRFLANPPKGKTETHRRKEKLSADFRAGAENLNREIDVFNLKAPTPQLHQRRIRIEEELKKFRDECDRRGMK